MTGPMQIAHFTLENLGDGDDVKPSLEEHLKIMRHHLERVAGTIRFQKSIVEVQLARKLSFLDLITGHFFNRDLPGRQL